MEKSKWIGCTIQKKFAEGIFSGKITSVERESGTKKWLCRVEYEDGDTEDLYLKEIKRHLVGPTPDPDQTLRQGYGEVKLGRLPDHDDQFFVRNLCRIPGGKVSPPESYPGEGKSSYLYWLRRISDQNYAMRSFCLAQDPDSVGARYMTFEKMGVLQRCVAWISPSNLDAHAKDPTIVDTVHSDLVDPQKGMCLLSGSNLESCVNASTECLFVHGMKRVCARTGFKGDVAAVRRCLEVAKGSLRCLSLTECTISREMLETIAECSNLSGLIISQCDMEQMRTSSRAPLSNDDSKHVDSNPIDTKDGVGATPVPPDSSHTDATVQNISTDDVFEEASPEDMDRALASLLTKCRRLRWIHLEGGPGQRMFGSSCWKALEAAPCPLLQVLWAETIGRKAMSFEGGACSRVLNSRDSLLPRQLRLCVINPDPMLRSEVINARSRR